MAVVSAASEYFQREIITPGPWPSPDTDLCRLFKEIEEDPEGPISVATQRDHTVFPDGEDLIYEHKCFKGRLLENLRAKLRADASVEEFCEHVWGLDTGKITAILSGDWMVNQSMLSRYERQPRGSSTRRRPFRAIWSNLQADVLRHFGMRCGDTQDVFCDMDKTYYLENVFAEGAPDLLRIWKSATTIGDEVDIAPGWPDVKAFVIFSRVPSASNYQEDAKAMVPPLLEIPTFATHGLSSRHDSLNAQGLPPSSRCHRVNHHLQRISTEKKADSSQLITEDEVRLATYAVECLTDYSRRYATGILVDGTSISLYYMDRNVCIKTTPFDFNTLEGAQYLALTVFALTQCDNIHAGFDPCIQLLQMSDGPSHYKLISNDHNATDSDAECFVFPQQTDAQPVFYQIEDRIHQFNRLFGHGMSTFTVEARTLGLQSVAHKRILKTVWRGKTSPGDAQVVEELKSNVPELEDFLPIVDDVGKWDAKALNFPWVQMTLPGLKNGEEMALQVSLSEPDLHLWEVETVENFKKIFKDCVTAHHLAWSKGGALHGSISEQSFGAYKQPEGSTDAYNGILKHWELGTQLSHRPPFDITNLKSSGVYPFDAPVFMAIDLAADIAHPHHLGALDMQHFYRHDLESFFYILVWACVHYSLADRHRDAPHPHEKIRGWLSLSRGAECKRELIQDDNFFRLFMTDLVKGEWTWLTQNWVMPLRNLFADGMRSIPDKESLSYREYDLETCNGRVTFDNFMKAVSDPANSPSSSL